MIWLIGSKGMLGQELANQLKDANLNFVATGSELDITDFNALAEFTQKSNPNPKDNRIDFIVNCAAYTAVDNAEDEDQKEKAFLVNEKGAENLAKIARVISATLIHISTDYVFDGSANSPLTEDSPKSPIGVYGMSKSAGEDKISNYMARYYILRTSWLYGWYGKNFVYTMAKLMSSKESIKVVADQKGTPTNCETLAKVIVMLIQSEQKNNLIPYGIFNVTDSGETTWFEFALTIQKLLKKYGRLDKNSNCIVNPCTSSEYPTKAKRPAYSVLDKTKIQKTLKIKLPSWKKSLEEFIKSKNFEVR